MDYSGFIRFLGSPQVRDFVLHGTSGFARAVGNGARGYFNGDVTARAAFMSIAQAAAADPQAAAALASSLMEGTGSLESLRGWSRQLFGLVGSDSDVVPSDMKPLEAPPSVKEARKRKRGARIIETKRSRHPWRRVFQTVGLRDYNTPFPGSMPFRRSYRSRARTFRRSGWRTRSRRRVAWRSRRRPRFIRRRRY